MTKLELAPLTNDQQKYMPDVLSAWRDFEASLDVMATSNDVHQLVIDHMLAEMRQSVAQIWTKRTQLH